MKNRSNSVLAAAVALALAGCAQDTPTSPAPMTVAPSYGLATGPDNEVTGERVVGKVAIEPALNADTGELMYLLTPEKATFPSKANGHAVSPLYLVEYPAGSTAAGDAHLNCEGVPGNCPDHDAEVAAVAIGAMPAVYGGGVLGHDHVADPPGKPDFNIAWEVIEIVFTPQGLLDGAVNTRLTTDTQIEAAIEAGDAIAIDLGFAFNCSVVPASLYWRGTPIG